MSFHHKFMIRPTVASLLGLYACIMRHNHCMTTVRTAAFIRQWFCLQHCPVTSAKATAHQQSVELWRCICERTSTDSLADGPTRIFTSCMWSNLYVDLHANISERQLWMNRESILAESATITASFTKSRTVSDMFYHEIIEDYRGAVRRAKSII